MPKKNNNKTKKSYSKSKPYSKKLKKRSMKSNISKDKYNKLLNG